MLHYGDDKSGLLHSRSELGTSFLLWKSFAIARDASSSRAMYGLGGCCLGLKNLSSRLVVEELELGVIAGSVVGFQRNQQSRGLQGMSTRTCEMEGCHDVSCLN